MTSAVRRPPPAPALRRRQDAGPAHRAGPRAAQSWRRALRRDWQLYSLAILPLLFFLVFRYLPMIGNVIAFRRFRPGGSIFGEYWVGLRYFRMFFDDPTFWHVFTNTLVLGGADPAVLLPAADRAGAAAQRGADPPAQAVRPVGLVPAALPVDRDRGRRWSCSCSRIDGTVNQLVAGVRRRRRSPFLQQPDWFRTIYVSSEVWQTVGWGTILYLAALTTIDEDLYEAARIDGANRWRQTWHVTLPGHPARRW